MATASENPGTPAVGQWLSQLQTEAGSARLGRGGSRFIQLMAREPEFASYAAVGEIAARTGIHASSVTRVAQTLGFSGWPELRAALREIYMASPVDRRSIPAAPTEAASTIEHDINNLRALEEPASREVITAIAQALRTSGRTVVMGSGLAAAPGAVLSHLGVMGGLDMRLSMDPATTQISLASTLTQADCLVGINVWRMTRAFYDVVQIARERGATTCVITDTPGSRLVGSADHILCVPTGSQTPAPSVAAMTSAAHLILNEALGDAGVRRARDVEKLWDRAALMDDHE